MKINRRGFTLVELLVTIVIIALVIGLTTFGIISVINNSKSNASVISENSIKEAANIYSSEMGSDSWKSTEYDFDAFCVTVGELMNKGLLDKDSTISVEGIGSDTFVMVQRNKVTLAVEKEIITKSNDSNYNICTGQVEKENDIVTKPSIDNYTSYTDRIEITFTDGSANSAIAGYKCLYGESSSNINREGRIDKEENKCIIDGAKESTNYNVYIYMNTEEGSSVLANHEGNEERIYNTKEFSSSTFIQTTNSATITYNDTNVLVPSHYFKSEINGISNINVEKCSLDRNNKFTCDGNNTTTIDGGSWYKVSSGKISITYPEETNTTDIIARIYDASNNFREDKDTLKINKYTIRFHKNNTSSISGSTNSYIDRSCISSGNESCSITSPSIVSLSGYSVIGWNTNKNATTSSWNVDTKKAINSNLNYYAITKTITYTITYNLNGGSVSGNPTSYNVETNTFTLNNPTREGYTFAGWTGSNGTSASTSVSISKGSTGNKSYTANWAVNTYTITYNLNGGSVSGNPTSYNVETNTFTLNNPTREGYTFAGWTGSNGTSASTSVSISKGSTGNKSYTANWIQNKVTIQYSVNGGTIQTYTGENTWTTNNDIIYKNGDPNFFTIGYENSTTIDGLVNWNNSNYINITKSGYSAASGAEWTCLSGCTTSGKTYNHNSIYNASDFCDTKNGNCTVVLGVNWKASTYTITYDANGGSGVPNNQTASSGVATNLSSTIPYRLEYDFAGWNTEKNGSGTTYNSGASYTGNANVTLYAQWNEHEHLWNAVGNTSRGAWEIFTCNYHHSYGFARYCSKCGMSVSYYNNVLKKYDTTGILACPNTGLTIYFNDSDLTIEEVGEYGGITNGQAMLANVNSIEKSSYEHYYFYITKIMGYQPSVEGFTISEAYVYEGNKIAFVISKNGNSNVKCLSITVYSGYFNGSGSVLGTINIDVGSADITSVEQWSFNPGWSNLRYAKRISVSSSTSNC